MSDAAHFRDYASRLARVLERHDWRPVQALAEDMLDCLHSGRQVFFAGNGGSAGNAIHLVNDFIYAMSKRRGVGLRAHDFGFVGIQPATEGDDLDLGHWRLLA